MKQRVPIEDPLRTLASSLLLLAGKVGNCFLVTSALDGEGKSAISASLARVLASSGKRVLLVDANLRHPSLHCIFRTATQPGLRQLLSEQPEGEREIQNVSTGLDLLPSGVKSQTEEPLVPGTALEHFLKTVRTRYDLILIDSPSALNWSDATLLARKTDGVIVVLSLGKAKTDCIRLLRQRMEAAGARVLGSVLNTAPIQSKSAPQGRHAVAQVTATAAGLDGLGLAGRLSTERSGE